MSLPIRNALEQLERELHRAGSGTLDYLRPGLTEEEITRVTASAGITLTDELAALWKWRDGSDPALEPHPPAARRLGPHFRLTSLQQAVDLARKQLQLNNEWGLETDHPGRWQAGWLLIGVTREPIAATCGPAPTSEVWVNDPYGNVLSASTLTEAVETWARALEQGWWEWRSAEQRWFANLDRIPHDISRRRLA